MALRDLNEELYKRDGEIPQPHRPKAFDPTITSAEDNTSREAFQNKAAWGEIGKEGIFDSYKRSWKVGAMIVGAIVSIAFVVLVVVKIQQSAFSNDKVTVRIDGPQEVGGSESSAFVIDYSNANRAALSNAEMVLSYPENFRPEPMTNMTVNGNSGRIHIGNIEGYSQGKVEIKGKFYGSKGSLAYLKASLQYNPKNLSSSFSAETQLGITVRTSSLRIDVDAPLEMASGDRVEYRIDYTNTSDASLNNLRLKAEYPAGFHYVESNPKVSEGDAVWYVGNIAPGQGGTIHITGTLDGSRNEAKILKVKLGTIQGNGDFLSYSDAERLTKIVTSPLVIVQTVNGLTQLNVNSGDLLNYTLQYRNEGDIGLRSAIVTVQLPDKLLDFSKLSLNGKGAFDSVRHIITWKASDIRELTNIAPGQSGSVSFSIPVLGNIPLEKNTDKNFVILSVAKIDSPDIPTPIGSNKIISSNTVNVKLNTKVGLNAAAVYQDDRIPNTGPNPPQIGQETTFTIHWSVFNTVNDVDKARLVAYLPTGVKWTGKVDSTENITYDERTNQIVWNIGNIANGVGITSVAKEAVFQVSVTPQENQPRVLMGEATLTAHDLFTDQEIRVTDDGRGLSF